MSDRIQEMSAEEFLIYLGILIFTEDEIAYWIRGHQREAIQHQLELAQTLSRIYGGAITGIVRTAIRELHNLPPVPGDPV